MLKGGGEETPAPGGGGGPCGSDDGLPGLWAPIFLVSSFKYLGRVLTMPDNYWPYFVVGLSKALRKWYRMSRILIQEGVDFNKFNTFYNSVVQAVLLFGS